MINNFHSKICMYNSQFKHIMYIDNPRNYIENLDIFIPHYTQSLMVSTHPKLFLLLSAVHYTQSGADPE